MSAKKFKHQASSSRAVSHTFGVQSGAFGNAGLGASQTFGADSGSLLSFVYEPPDLSAISEPNVIVALKNLQKKDGTTKTKALEELQASIGDKILEDSFLEPWIKLYPRASIDSSRQVRRLAHLLHGDICSSSGKRIAKYMPRSVGALLAGIQDHDRVVSRAAQAGFQKTFPSETKQRVVWKAYQQDIINYCTSAILKETVNTLSDERTTRPDDAESKYARVIGAAILTVTNALDTLALTELQACQSFYSDLLRNKIIWKFASNVNSFVRNAVYRLLQSCLLKPELKLLDLSLISKYLLQGALSIDQTGSALEFSKSLAQLSTTNPGVWTEYYSDYDNKSSKKRLCQFLRNGSRGGPPEFWHQVSLLLQNVPRDLLLPDTEDTGSDRVAGEKEFQVPVLSAIHRAINDKGEPRSNNIEAWRTYLLVTELSIPSSEIQDQFMDKFVSPLIDQYVSPSAEVTEWTIGALDREHVCVEASILLLRRSPETFRSAWKRISSEIVERMQASLPLQSKNYRSSQDSVSLIFKTWYSLQASIIRQGVLDKAQDLFVDTSVSECRSAISILKSRNGKPYCAAAALDFATNLVPENTIEQEDTRELLLSFFRSDLQRLLLSPSSFHLINLLSAFRDEPAIPHLLASSIKALLDAADTTARFETLKTLIASPWLGQEEVANYLEECIKRSLKTALQGAGDSWTLVTAAVGNKSITNRLCDQILASMTESLSMKEHAASALYGLDMASKKNDIAFKAFSSSSEGAQLLSRLLFLADDKDLGLAEEASKLSAKIRDSLRHEGEATSANTLVVEIIRNGIHVADDDSLSIPSLVTEATQLILKSSEEEKCNIIDTLLPDRSSWKTILDPFIHAHIDASLAITNPLGDVLNLVEQSSDVRPDYSEYIARDSNGFSSALRMAWFVTELCTNSSINGHITSTVKTTTCQQLALFVTLLSDNISIPREKGMWLSSDNSADSKPVTLFAEVWSLLVSWLHAPQPEATLFIRTVQENLLADSQGTSPLAYYSARAYTAIASELEEYNMDQVNNTDEELLKAVKDKSNPITAMTTIASLSDPKKALLISNKLIADLTGFKISENPTEGKYFMYPRDLILIALGLRQLVLLNTALAKLDSDVELPQPRIVFFVKHLVSQMDGTEDALNIIIEILKVFQCVLPLVREIYGSFWAKIFGILRDKLLVVVELDNIDIPFAYVSVRFCMLLKALSEEDSNDDLVDLWVVNQPAIAELLIRLMKRQADFPDDAHQPRRILNERLSRALEKLTPGRYRDPESLYPIVLSEASSLQYLAWFLLHKQIPRDQEEASVEAALSRESKMRLPEELLSLILTAPAVYYTTSNDLESASQMALKGYLLSWILVFDHWTNASYKLQSYYVACIKDGTYLKDFLDLAFEFLIESRRKPVDASSLDIEGYSPSTEYRPEKDIQWAMIHVYYLCLKYLPTLARAWWRDECPRQLQRPVESWTEKYISPTVIRSELRTAAAWLPTQDATDQQVDVKISYANEITASLPLDDQEMSIRISLPPSYPLSPVLVDSINRVGIDEKKWRSWLLTTAGVINFSGTSGALIEGLITWRKNVTGALKGQGECAICYSVVSADKQLPNKMCGTCKKQFHASCLYKWFKSSGSSSCPLCRNAFNYG